MTDKYGWPTTRRFPNTLAQAFPKDPENYQWFFPPERKRGALEYALLSAAFWIWVGLAYWYVNA